SKTQKLPDYGIDSQLKRIQELYKKIEETKKDQAIVQNSDKDMFPSIQEATKPETKTSDISPIAFDPVKENYERYKNSPCFKDLGFIPGRDNESLYKACEGRLQNENTNTTLIFVFLIGG